MKKTNEVNEELLKEITETPEATEVTKPKRSRKKVKPEPAPEPEPTPEDLEPLAEMDPFDDFNPEPDESIEIPEPPTPDPDQFENIEKDRPKTRSRKRATKKAPAQVTKVSGYMLLFAVDLVFPFAISMFMPKKKAKDLKLSPEEMQELRPFAEEAAASLSVNMNPMTAFIIAAGMIYASKTV